MWKGIWLLNCRLCYDKYYQDMHLPRLRTYPTPSYIRQQSMNSYTPAILLLHYHGSWCEVGSIKYTVLLLSNCGHFLLRFFNRSFISGYFTGLKSEFLRLIYRVCTFFKKTVMYNRMYNDCYYYSLPACWTLT